jgi:hypothetical protein
MPNKSIVTIRAIVLYRNTIMSIRNTKEAFVSYMACQCRGQPSWNDDGNNEEGAHITPSSIDLYIRTELSYTESIRVESYQVSKSHCKSYQMFNSESLL